MAEFRNMLDAVIIGNWLSNNGPSRGEFADSAAISRAKNIEDNFGVKPETLPEYRKSHGGNGFLKAAGWVAGALVVGAMFHVVVGALVVGAVIGAISYGRQQSKTRQGYSDYLDNVAAEGRVARDRSHARAQGIEYDNGSGRKSFTADLAASREQSAYAGSSR